MTKYLLGLLIISLFVVAGCSKPVKFTGKSETWSVDCSINPSSKERSYQIRYIAADRQPVENVSFSFQDSSNFHESGTDEGPTKNIKISGKSTPDTPYVEENSFKLVMNWNDKTETIQVVKQ